MLAQRDAYYDPNGNVTSGAEATFRYEEANRVEVAETTGANGPAAGITAEEGPVVAPLRDEVLGPMILRMVTFIPFEGEFDTQVWPTSIL
jgi:hypothetical protein